MDTKQGFEFKIRKFSNTAVMPYDVGLYDYNEGVKYSDPNLCFLTPDDAREYLQKVKQKLSDGSIKIVYFLNKWNMEGPC